MERSGTRDALTALLVAVVMIGLAATGTARAGEVVLDNGDVLTGDVYATAEHVEIRHATLGKILLPRARVKEVRGASAASPEDAPPPPAPCEPPPCAPPAAPPCERPWKFRAGGALSVATGNTEAFDMAVDAEAVRKPDPWGLRLGLAYVYGEKEGDVSLDRWHGIARVDRALDAGACSYVFGQALWDRDEIAGLSDRVSVVLGYGRNLLKREGAELKGEVGAGATYEQREGQESTIDPSAYLGLHYLREWADKTRFHADLDLLPNLGDFDLSVAHFVLGYEIPMSTALRLVFGLHADYVVDPPGDTESLDLLLTAGFGIEI